MRWIQVGAINPDKFPRLKWNGSKERREACEKKSSRMRIIQIPDCSSIFGVSPLSPSFLLRVHVYDLSAKKYWKLVNYRKSRTIFFFFFFHFFLKKYTAGDGVHQMGHLRCLPPLCFPANHLASSHHLAPLLLHRLVLFYYVHKSPLWSSSQTFLLAGLNFSSHLLPVQTRILTDLPNISRAPSFLCPDPRPSHSQREAQLFLIPAIVISASCLFPLVPLWFRTSMTFLNSDRCWIIFGMIILSKHIKYICSNIKQTTVQIR